MRAKFGNIKTVVDGVTYDSKKEAKRAGELALLARAGEVYDLKHQPVFAMVVNRQVICTYIADFSYLRGSDGSLVVEDVKSPITRTQPVYRLKKKLLKALHGLDVVEV